MKRYLTIAILFCICILMVQAQGISVKSFQFLETDLTANTVGTIEYDQNGDVAALIKVVTTQTGFSFNGGALGIVKAVQKPAEIWVYVPHGIKKISISHPTLGTLQDYYIPFPIDAARVYEMVLTTSEDESSKHQTGVNFSSSPAMADIYIDGEKYGQTPNTISDLTIGEHKYRISRHGYADYNGTLTIREGELTQVSAILNIEFFVSSTNPNAKLYIDGVEQGFASGPKYTTPGQHQIRLIAEGWQEYTETIDVSVSQLSFNFSMEEILQPRRSVTVGNVSFDMVLIDGGTFMMGATPDQGEKVEKCEQPPHQVTLSSYYIGETEVTQELWKAVMGKNPSESKGPLKPVDSVSWNDCQEFIKKLNQKTGLRFRLPTEAEWEFAARGGNKSKGYMYSGSNDINSVAWYSGNSGKKHLNDNCDEDLIKSNKCQTHNVKTKQPNELGIYDMSGNVEEWCEDWFDSKYYQSSPAVNPRGPISGSFRVTRDGRWNRSADFCRVARRGGYRSPETSSNDRGLRLAL